VRAFGGWMVLQDLRRTAQEAIAPALLERCRRLQQRIGITALVRYAYSEVVDAPAVVGWFRPIVLIPVSAMSGLSMEQLEAIIAHELAHIRRYDALVNLFQIATETILFYHPAVWWVNSVIRTERENCCDDIAVAVCGNAGEYARALATMGSARPSWAMAANGGALKARVGRLLGMQKITHGIPRAGLAVLALLCASCILLAAGGYRQDPPPPPVAPLPPASALLPEPPAAPEAPLPPPSAPAGGKYQNLARSIRIHAEAERLYDERKIAELQQSIASMSARYTSDYPELLGAQQQLAALENRLNDDQAPVAPEPNTQDRQGSYIDALTAAGLSNLSVEDLISLKVQGVTADYVRQIKAAGFDPTIRELISLKVQGVSPEYIRDIHATGLKPSVHELIGMKIQGVSPEFVRALQSAGLGDLKLRDFISAKIQGVTPEFIEKVRSHGFKDLTLRQLMSLKMADVF